jgi:TPR repeat protein
VPRLITEGRKLINDLLTSADVLGSDQDARHTVDDKLRQAAQMKAELSNTYPVEGLFWRAMDAYNRQEFSQAAENFLLAANAGDPEAQFYIGVLYRTGRGVEPDLAASALWMERSAKQGYHRAQTDLATMYVFGDGVRRDYSKALRLFRMAADQKNGYAAFNLAGMYLEGKGIQKDEKTSAQWFFRAAEFGNIDAMVSLGRMYVDGNGVPRDLVRGYAWFDLASKSPSKSQFGNNPVAMRDAIAAKLSEEELRQAKNQANKWPPKP